MPMARARRIIENSLAATAGNRIDGSLMIQSPPRPLAGIVSPP